MAILDRHQTIVRNTSGSTRFFSFLPPHGRRLTAGQDAAFKGNLFAWLSRDARDDRGFEGFQAAVAAGDLKILQTPTVTQYDVVGGDVREVTISGGSVTASAPEFGSYSGAAPTFG